MSNSVHYPQLNDPQLNYPQLDRVISRIESLDAPVVQVWGWPGSGRAAILEALLAKLGGRARALSLAVLDSEEGLVAAIADAYEAGVPWLVANGAPHPGRIVEAERRLRLGQRLVIATGQGLGGGALLRGIVSPQELLLNDREIAGLAIVLTGGDLSPQAARSLRLATDGWYRPLRLAFEATGGLGLEGTSPEEMLEIPSVRLFLRHEVIDAFAAEERDLVLAAPDARPAAGESGEEAWRLLDDRGLWIEGPERDGLPRLLAAALERERRRRRPARGVPPPAPASTGAAALPAVYTLGLLGTPISRQRDEEGERELDWRLRRSLQVLAFLASSPGLQAGREEVIEAVWPTEGERTIERNFHPTLSHLRRTLEGGHRGKDRPSPLLFRNGVYRLNPEVGWEVDVVEFHALADEGRKLAEGDQPEPAAEVWQRAWKLYRGPFLQGYYEAWITARRETYQRRYLELLRDLGELLDRLGRKAEAMDAYRTALVEDPFQERVHVEVMRLYAEQGRRDLARRQYDHLCRILLEELGQPPEPETTRKYHQFMG
jgi:DNA-binding SARP family transcriptional activator